MIRQLLKAQKTISFFVFGLILNPLMGQEDIPFNCDYNAYLFQYNDVYAIDLASGNAYQVAADVTQGNINAAAYNPQDGYIWGSLSTPAKSIVRIGKNFTTTNYYIDELPNSNRYVGGINAEGLYYLKGGGSTYYKINLDPDSSTYGQHEATETLSQPINIHDWAFNAVDGQLYTVEKNSNKLYRINPDNGVVTSLGIVPILDGNNYTYGAVYFDADGRFYISANQTGTIYVIQEVQNVNSSDDMDSNLFAFGPSSASNDGARCPTAPVPQEICDNGIDDDGDGLIDCEDPSCSGFGQCAVIEPPTSGANAGGLESNNRLSQQINERNFRRAKSGYTFNRHTAQRLVRHSNYAARNSSNEVSLEDFIPLEIIGETETINATPSDLIGITNATEIFAVDYMNYDIPIASVLALKTTDGVYEHTKYICDRLLGAELISVSTMTIHDQPFIKSIIRNENGTYEFVLSFSARLANNAQNFVVESHWNLDQYPENETYYNFQIWSNTIDDLYLLGQEVLNLLQTEKPIVDYSISSPPAVFVRKGSYDNGALNLELVNTNGSTLASLNAGLRRTETSAFESFNTTIELNGQYLTNHNINTGNLFDIGFRIESGMATPDDLFLSDGPWGTDASEQGTSISLFDVRENSVDFDSSEYPIERNIELRATTSSYVAVYRAMTPRFKPVDLSDFDSFKVKAKGEGILEIAFVKASVSNWEEQFKAEIPLTPNLQDYVIHYDELENSFGETADLSDVVTIVFTMVSENGESASKTLTLEHMRFSQTSLSLQDNSFENITLKAYPNPMSQKATISFNLPNAEDLRLKIYDQLGKQVFTETLSAKAGRNSFEIHINSLSPGLYFCKLDSRNYDINPIKLIIN